jgi:hypothetical protein
MTPKTIEVHIEELVLHGFAPGDRYAIGDAVQAELTRLFAERGLPQTLSEAEEYGRLDGGTIVLAPGSTAAATGGQIGHAVFEGVRR